MPSSIRRAALAVVAAALPLSLATAPAAGAPAPDLPWSVSTEHTPARSLTVGLAVLPDGRTVRFVDAAGGGRLVVGRPGAEQEVWRGRLDPECRGHILDVDQGGTRLVTAGPLVAAPIICGVDDLRLVVWNAQTGRARVYFAIGTASQLPSRQAPWTRGSSLGWGRLQVALDGTRTLVNRAPGFAFRRLVAGGADGQLLLAVETPERGSDVYELGNVAWRDVLDLPDDAVVEDLVVGPDGRRSVIVDRYAADGSFQPRILTSAGQGEPWRRRVLAAVPGQADRWTAIAQHGDRISVVQTPPRGGVLVRDWTWTLSTDEVAFRRLPSGRETTRTTRHVVGDNGAVAIGSYERNRDLWTVRVRTPAGRWAAPLRIPTGERGLDASRRMHLALGHGCAVASTVLRAPTRTRTALTAPCR